MRRIRLASVLMLGAAALTACNDDPGPTNGPSRQETSETSSATATESATGTESAAPATGPVVEGPTYTFRLPAGWRQKTEGVAEGSQAALSPEKDGFTYLIVHAQRERNFDDARRPSSDVLKSFRGVVKQGKKLPATEWGGEPAYHLAGDDSIAGFAEQFGVIWRDEHISIFFDFYDKGGKAPWPAAKRRDLIASVEASWEWT